MDQPKQALPNRQVRRAFWWSVALCSFLALSGCGLAWPSFYQPGDLEHQRERAVLHDPYPDSDAGPEVVGGRPPDFRAPLSEPVRSRWLRDSWWYR